MGAIRSRIGVHRAVIIMKYIVSLWFRTEEVCSLITNLGPRAVSYGKKSSPNTACNAYSYSTSHEWRRPTGLCDSQFPGLLVP